MFKLLLRFGLSILATGLLASPVLSTNAWASPESTAPGSFGVSAPEGLAAVGRGSLSWFGLEIYDAILWTERGDFTGPGFDQRLALRIDYHRNITSSKLAERTRKEWRRLERDVRLPEDAIVEQWLVALETMWPDVGPGDYILTVAEPGGPTRFEGAGGELGVIEDPAFGPAFLSIWLHPRTSRPDLRMALVGSNRGQR